MNGAAAGNQRTTWAWRLAIVAVVAIGIGLRIATFDIFDTAHADEFMQYLEQGNRLATGHGIVPWEVRYGARNAIIPQLLAGPLALGHALWPGTLGAVWLVRGLWAVLCAGLTLVAAWRIGAAIGRIEALVALFAAAVWWESVIYTGQLLSESLAAALLLTAAPGVLARRPDGFRGDMLAGLALGLAVLVRFQCGVFAAVLVAMALGTDMRRWRAVIAGGMIPAVVGVGSDLANGQAPFAWVIENLRMNVGAANRAAAFGVSPPWAYLPMILRDTGPAALFVAAGAVLCPARLRPLLAAALAHLAAHSLIGHKEFRFIWPSELTFVVLAAVSGARLARRFVAHEAGAAALACAVVAGLSGLALAASGGAASMRGGGALSRLAQVAAARGDTCGLVVPANWQGFLVPAMLPRPIPLFVAPDGMTAVPPTLDGAANVAILRSSLAPAGWRRGLCKPMLGQQACLFVRAGACHGGAMWSSQATLLRWDL